MSHEIPTPEQSSHENFSPPVASSHQAVKPQRVLACQSCQQRKVKCDRKFPCANCTKAGTQCLSASLVARQRRRRFPERMLLERLRHYEDLLLQNKIAFEPLHPGTTGDANPDLSESSQRLHDKKNINEPILNIDSSLGDLNVAERSTAKNFWHAMNHKSQSSEKSDVNHPMEQDAEDDDSDTSSYLLQEHDVKNAWDSLYESNDHLLFCSRSTTADLSDSHPSQIQIFQLWQIYLENVDPLLKVTHTPTLQPRIISAAGNVARIDSTLEALMFGIYCMAIFSMGQSDCMKQFGTSRNNLLKTYQLGAREALLKCGFLKSSDRDCLTALHFYLISIKPATDPRSLSSILGAATRIAQRMGLHDEAINSKHTNLEAELRRRLWWSLVLFDARISEMAEFKTGLLVPTWSCKPPMNANDFDLRSETKAPASNNGMTSEALFAVIRSKMGDFIRFSDFHLDFINPALKAITRGGKSQSIAGIDEFDALETLLEDDYLRHCDQGNPLHFMTVWWTRGQIAKTRFLHSLSQHPASTIQRTDAHRDAGLSYALKMLECDTKAICSELTQGFRWLIYLNFPFPAYVHIVQDLRRRPIGDHVATAWETMSQNCNARFLDLDDKDNPMERKANPFLKIFAGVVMAAWSAREAAMMDAGVVESPPSIVTQLGMKLAQLEVKAGDYPAAEQESRNRGAENTDLNMSGTVDPTLGYTMSSANSLGSELDSFSMMNMPPSMVMEPNHWRWPAANWNSLVGHGW